LDECVRALRALLSSEHSDTVSASRLLAEALRRVALDPSFVSRETRPILTF
jgi:hypothetical protein